MSGSIYDVIISPFQSTPMRLSANKQALKSLTPQQSPAGVLQESEPLVRKFMKNGQQALICGQHQRRRNDDGRAQEKKG